MKRAWALVLALLACSGLASPGPEEVARQYFDAAIAGDTGTVQSLVTGECLDTKIGRGGPVIAFGVPIDVDALELELASDDGTTAEVRYAFSGTLERADAEVSTELFGKPVEVSIGDLSVGIDRISGSLWLERVDGAWRVACPLALP